MNRHERRKARALGGTQEPEGYRICCDATLAVFQAFLLAHPNDPPRFALLPPHIGAALSVLDIGHRHARNESAHTLVELWIRMTRELKLADGPTYAMMRQCIIELGTPYDIVTLDELGYKVAWGPTSPGGDA